jgi:hypothetical protein
VDKGCIGDAIIDELNNIHVPGIEGVFFTDTAKENMLNNLKLLMEHKRLKIAGDDKALIAQMNEQQHEYLQPKPPWSASTSNSAIRLENTTTNSWHWHWHAGQLQTQHPLE